MPIKDLTNKKFGKLRVVEYYGNARWKCLCDCGKETIVRSDYLKSGHTTSCGCVHKKYGGNVKNDRLYRLYRGIIQRTESVRKDKHNHTYIDKNIKMCDEWRTDFMSFKKWCLNNGYDYSKTKNQQTIDRIDNDKGYEPLNCRFVTIAKNNKTRNIQKGVICLTKSEQKEIYEKHKKGISSIKLGKIFNVSKTTILKVIKNFAKEELE